MKGRRKRNQQHMYFRCITGHLKLLAFNRNASLPFILPRVYRMPHCLLLALNAIIVPAQVVLVKIALLYVVGHLALALASLLGVLELETMLVHREAHGL